MGMPRRPRPLTPTPDRGTMNGAMYTVFKDFTFAAAHAIRGHTGGCQNLHGHNYRVRVQVAATRLDALGMVIDFADLKRVVGEVLGPFDHRLINDIPPFDQRNTTAELLAEYVFREVAGAWTTSGCRWRGWRCGRTTPPAPSTPPTRSRRGDDRARPKALR